MKYFVAKFEQEFGPYSLPEIKDYLASGAFEPKDRVRIEGSTQTWRIEQLLHQFRPLAPEPAAAADGASPEDAVARPWLRFWARATDILVGAFLLGTIVGLVRPALLAARLSDQTYGMLVLFAWIFVEAALLAQWGTTPGKALFRIRLTRADGAKLDFAAALKRSFTVWWRGMGLGIPVVSLIALALAYKELGRSKLTPWDRKGGFRVAHGGLSPARITAIIMFYLAFLYLLGLAMARR